MPDTPPDNSSGLLTLLADLHPDILVSIQGLARLVHRSDESVRRAIEASELPPPVSLFGQRYWTIGVLREHLLKRLAHAAQEHDTDVKRVYKLERRP